MANVNFQELTLHTEQVSISTTSPLAHGTPQTTVIAFSGAIDMPDGPQQRGRVLLTSVPSDKQPIGYVELGKSSVMCQCYYFENRIDALLSLLAASKVSKIKILTQKVLHSRALILTLTFQAAGWAQPCASKHPHKEALLTNIGSTP